MYGSLEYGNELNFNETRPLWAYRINSINSNNSTYTMSLLQRASHKLNTLDSSHRLKCVDSTGLQIHSFVSKRIFLDSL